MSDAVFFAAVGLLCAAMITLALAWPQGWGARSPAPFGHVTAAELRDAQTNTAAPELKGIL
jgi:hypothetical protein